ncbi:hypothetical protein [Reinekea marinisedimentorum]|uniref:Transglycosylase-like protein with SLT domain n=1 Tax=Reinekea marinisedimentorum TaxID=230495 RepID=A0A4R3I6G5_9GAMM|nr:hypothetical protein [Reinekea marinisedimentorum]TCS40762.1 hypothetical protein BCF53_108127 [Reinekea marinisedimentorum]
MMFTIQQLHNQVVQPALNSMGAENKELSAFLSLLMMPELSPSQGLFGPFQITSETHHAVWDNYLALDPEKASCVRGLASQRRFLETPDLELNLNWGYAVAISASVLEMNTAIAVSALTEQQLAEIWFQHCVKGNHVNLVKNYYLQRKSELNHRTFAA